MTRNQIRMVQVIVGCVAGGVTAAVTAIEGGASLGLAIALGFAAFGATFATAALVPRTAEANNRGGPKPSDGKPMRYDVPSVLPRMLLQGRRAIRFFAWHRGAAPVIGTCLCLASGCGMTRQERVQTVRDAARATKDAACASAVAVLDAIEVAAHLCDGDEQCLGRLEQRRAEAMQAATLACEERG